MLNWLRTLLSSPPADLPDFLQAYLDGFDAPLFGKKTPITEVPFVVFDTETTGLDHKKDKLLSIGAVKVQHWQIDIRDHLELYVEQKYQPQPKGEAISVHGILPKGHQQTVSETEALQRFLSFCGSSVLVAHHLGFDLSIINRLMHSYPGVKLKNKGVDTAVLARRLANHPQLAKRGTFGLDQLCQDYHIPMSDRHTAAGDAYITAILLMKMLRRLEKRGVRTLGDLLSTRRSGLR